MKPTLESELNVSGATRYLDDLPEPQGLLYESAENEPAPAAICAASTPPRLSRCTPRSAC